MARLYDAAERQLGSDSLDRLLADLDFDAIENALIGFLAQIRNEAAIDGVDRSSTWVSALSFVTDILRHGSSAAGSRAGAIETRLLRLDRLYGQLSPTPATVPPPIRALPPAVIDELYAIFDPSSDRTPFKTAAMAQPADLHAAAAPGSSTRRGGTAGGKCDQGRYRSGDR
ncbi:hypothetical protein [Bradyrhizobium cenepequi]